MKTIEWNNGVNDDSFATASAWTPSVVPVAGDIAVISSVGDVAPTKNSYTGIIFPTTGPSVTDPGSEAYLFDPGSEATATEETDTLPNGDIIYYYVTPQEYTGPGTGTVLPGETIHPADLDLIGGTSEAALALQNSTIAATTVTNVSGDAYVYAGYTNTLKGNIDIGEPFSVNGKLVTSTVADANSFYNALYIAVQSFGSWVFANTSATYSASGYVPGVVSDGTISVAASSALVVSVSDFTEKTSTTGTFTPPTVSAFTNDGSIKVAAGGAFLVTSYDYQGEFINNGSVTLSGSANEATYSDIQSSLQGTGSWTLSGGSQTDVADTRLQLVNHVTGQTFKIADAELWVDGGSGISANNIVVSGGTVDFDGSSGLLLISTPIITETTTPPVNTIFSDSISGFAKGDQIQLGISLVPGNTLIADGLSWDQTSSTAGTLDVSFVTTSSLGTTTTQEAALALNGKYTNADFSKSVSGSVSTEPTLTILTSVAKAAASSLLPGDWTATSELGLTGNMMHGAAAGFMNPDTVATTDSVAAFAHLNLLAYEHISAGFHQPA
jgi:hypothetical protein